MNQKLTNALPGVSIRLNTALIIISGMIGFTPLITKEGGTLDNIITLTKKTPAGMYIKKLFPIKSVII